MSKRRAREQHMSKRVSKKSSKNSSSSSLNEGSRTPLTPQEVKRVFLEGVTVPTMIALGILTPKGGASPNAHRKIKQVNHFLRLLTPALDDLFERYEEPCIVDMGAGKAAISLALYDRWIRPKGRGRLIAIEGRLTLAAKVREVTSENYEHINVIAEEILTATLPQRVHLTIALHACDQATDHAILQGLKSKSDYFALVPCCQAEVARLLKPIKSKDYPIASLWSEGIHRREFGSHLTNVIRTLTLRSLGYAVTVTELTGWEHSLKNELILGRRVARFHQGATQELETLLNQIPVDPWLIHHIRELQ